MTAGGRLFQALVPAAEKDQSSSVDLRVAGTTNADELEDLSAVVTPTARPVVTAHRDMQVPGCAYT